MNKYYKLLGLHIKDVEKFFEDEKISYTIKEIKGFKDQDKLLFPRVIKIIELGNGVEIITTCFSDSLK